MNSALARIGDYLRGLAGWRAFGVSVLSGAIFALGFPPFALFPALLLALAALVLLLDGVATRPNAIRRAFGLGWGFGFGQFVVGMHWIFYPFLVDPAEHAWQIPFVALFFPGGLALFPAVACAAAMYFWRNGPSRILIFALAYAIAEWLRGHILTGLPWNLPAYGWSASLSILQSAALFGAYGLSLLTVLFGAALAELFTQPRRIFLPAVMAILFVLIFIAGTMRLIASPTDPAGVLVRIVQPNIPQDEKYVRRLVTRNWRTLMDLSNKQATPSPSVIIWPEAAPPVLLQRAPTALDEITVLTGSERILITGNQRVVPGPSGRMDFYNSLYVFGHGGQLLATYDKFHLVPFGEYLPFEPLLNSLGITKLVGMPGSFSAGDGPRTLPIPGIPDVGPLICYEILFPGAVIGGTRPHWLINVTDDSWFGPWAGPRQHLLSARVRAIEEGLPVARAANTGISAMIDPDGRVIAELGLDHAGTIDAQLPRALPPTPYSRVGDLLFAILLALTAGGVWALGRKSG